MIDIQTSGVAVFDGFFSRDYCHKLIDYFEWAKATHKTWGRGEAETRKNDEATCISFGMDDSAPLLSEFNDIFWNQCYSEYTKVFSVLNDYSKHGILTYKVQKTMPGQGYHVWHSEAMNPEMSKRIGTYLLYLNDVEDGGETEFLYLSERVAPKAGRLLVFPAGYVHTHRGNPPLKDTKYIMTGWTEFV